MDRQEQERPHFAELSPRSFLYDYPNGEHYESGSNDNCHVDGRYQTGKIVEINSHSLFSKWFSESGKLVQKLFSKVNEMVDDEDCFVVVMIGESLCEGRR